MVARISALHLIVFILVSCSTTVYAQNAPNNIVRTIAGNNSDLYVGGDFTQIANKQVNYIAHWNGTEWQALGSIFQGLDGPVHAIAIDGEKVYVGGEFTQAGTVSARNIAVWNRTTRTWSAMQKGVGGTLRSAVKSIVIHQGQVYVGGQFIAAGTTVAVNIARWDGQKWHRVGTGANASIQALYIDGEHLYAGGKFSIAGNLAASRLARYHLGQKQWEDLGIEIDGRQARVEAIAADDQYLYVGGVFDVVDNQPAQNIIRVNKQTLQWSPMMQGLEGYSYEEGGSSQVEGVRSILVQADAVITGGTITQAFTSTTNGDSFLPLTGLAKWDGQKWSNPAIDSSIPVISQIPLGLYFQDIGTHPPVVYTLYSDLNDTIHIGGDFERIYQYLNNGVRFVESPYLCKLIVNKNIVPPSTVPCCAEKNQVRTTESQSNSLPSTIVSRIAPDLEQTISALPAPAQPANLDCDRYEQENMSWLSVGTGNTTDNGILALAADETEVYAGGTFTTLFSIQANGVAVRSNGEWQPLNDGISPGVNGFVYAIAIDGPNVYVAGQFTQAGGIPANNIAVWNRVTHTWSALGGGVSSAGNQEPFISDITLQGERIYVAGSFSHAGSSEANNIAQWNGSTWSTLAEGIDGSVNALEIYQGDLYAAGSFNQAGTINSSSIARWDGQAWQAVAEGLNGYVNDLELFISLEGDTNLAVGGSFTVSVDTLYGPLRDRVNRSGLAAQGIVMWNGNNWFSYAAESETAGSTIQEPVRLLNGEIRALHAIGLNLYVAGTFTDVFPKTTGSAAGNRTYIARFNRFRNGTPIQANDVPIWHTLQGGLNGNANALAHTDEGLYVGGDFTKAPGQNVRADHIALWNTIRQRWDIVANPYPLYPVRAILYENNTLFAAGLFTAEEAGPYSNSTRIVQFTGVGWRTLLGTVQGTPATLTAIPNNEFVLGGTTITSDGKIAVNVSRWNPNTHEWQPLTPGSGVASLENISFVSAVAGNANTIVVGGQFDIADTITAHNIAQWDRATEQWTKLGDGLNGIVRALAFDQTGNLYAAGEFSRSGSAVLRNIAHWNGTEWLPLGDGIDGHVLALAALDGKIYAGGRFRNAGQTEAINVAVWDPTTQTWSQLGLGLDSDFEPAVNVLTARNGYLFAGGKFEVSGPDSIVNVARWNPGGWWDRLGSGTDQQVSSIAINPENGEVYVSGDFRNAGCKPSQYIARWLDPTLSVEQESPLFTYSFTTSTQPNPFTGSTRVHLNFNDLKTQRVELTLYDESGRLVQQFPEGVASAGEYSVEIDGSALASGAYFMQVKSTAGTGTVKLVKQ